LCCLHDGGDHAIAEAADVTTEPDVRIDLSRAGLADELFVDFDPLCDAPLAPSGCPFDLSPPDVLIGNSPVSRSV